mgnify:CR=1 FL=1
MNNRVSTAEDFRQAFLQALIEVEIPEYGTIQMRLSRYNPVFIEHNNLSPREFAVKLLDFVIYSPSTTLDEIQTWDDQIIEEAIRAWLSGEDSNKWVLPEDVQFFEALQHAYEAYLEDYLREMQKAMEPLAESIRNSVHLLTEAFSSLQANLNRIADSVQIEIPTIQLGRFFENLPDFTELTKQVENYRKAANVLDDGGFHFLLRHRALTDVSEFVRIDRIDPKIRKAVVTNKLLHLTRQTGFIHLMKECFEKSDVLQRRWRIVEQALTAHQNRHYGTSIPTLLAQIEGIFTDALVLKGSVKQDKGKLYARDQTGAIKLGKDGNPVQLHGLGQKVQNSDLQDEPLLQDLAQFLTESSVKGRNDIMHGRIVNYDKAKLSVQLLLYTYLLAAEFVDFEGES